MAEAIGCGRKLDGHEGFYLPAKEFELRFVLKDVCPSLQVWEEAIDDFLPGNCGQEIIQDDPLIMPAHSLSLVEVWLIGRAPPIHAVKIEARSSEVDERVRLVFFLQTAGWIKSEVVIDELTEVSVSATDALVLCVVHFGLRRRFPLA